MEISISKEAVNCESSYTLTSYVRKETISTPTSILMNIKSANIKYGAKKKLNE